MKKFNLRVTKSLKQIWHFKVNSPNLKFPSRFYFNKDKIWISLTKSTYCIRQFEALVSSTSRVLKEEFKIMLRCTFSLIRTSDSAEHLHTPFEFPYSGTLYNVILTL